MFELPRPTSALLASVLNRAENHGEDKCPAVSFGLTITTHSANLASLCPELVPLLGTRGVDAVTLKTTLDGMTVLIGDEADDEPIRLARCKVDRFKVSPKNDGAVELRVHVASTDLDPLRLGLLGMKVQQEITVSMTAPKGATQTNNEEEARALDKQRALEAQGQQRIEA